jgi:predicted AAA+ superfamily ATPase
MYKKRLVENTLLEAVRTFPVVMITGPRQCGKTTLVKQLLGARYSYVSIDEIDNRLFATEDPRGFLAKYKRPLIIDEIQNAPELLTYIKGEVDKRREPGQWVLTGSQRFSLMRHVSESLAGRVAVLNMYSFTNSELSGEIKSDLKTADAYLRFISEPRKLKIRDSLGEYLFRGGYPEPSINAQVSHRLWFSSYLQTYIDRDVRSYIRESNLHDFERFVKLLAARTAQQLNFSALAKDIGVSVPTIKTWVSFLEASSLIYLLYPYSKNFGKRLIKAPKCYFTDTGLVSFLSGIQEPEHLLHGPMAGALFETACVNDIMKRFSAKVYPESLYYWRSTDGLEVDLLVEMYDSLVPFEFKLTSTIMPRHFSNLIKWKSVYGGNIERAFIVSNDNKIVDGNGVRNINFAGL